ncbi:MAG: nitrogen regulation protein NR(I) [Proteobacteria bacterium]|nr:nitrogen regulation protein NR(I) [Pseudomonadota bacterium]
MSGETILVADDDGSIRTVIDRALSGSGFDVKTTPSAAVLWGWVADGEGDVVVTDVVMPDGDGLELLAQIKEVRPELPIVVMSARSTLLTAVSAAERGAFEYLPKPFDINELIRIVNLSLEEKGRLHEPLSSPLGSDDKIPIVGRSAAMQEVFSTMARVVSTGLSVLVTGESGTGKELIARALHDYGRRRDMPFVAVNMAAIPRDLIEAELFGYERGAFTGAYKDAVGRFAQADQGTLFLDEIGDMPLDAQTRLLRVLQQSEFTPVGGRRPVSVDVRIIAASNRDVGVLVQQGRFREDLYYRLNVVPIRIPPLRERREDIPDLVRHFLVEGVRDGLPAKAFDKAAIDRLKAHDWYGNVRELENAVRRMIALRSEEVIGEEAVRAVLDGAMQSAPWQGIQEENLGAAVGRHLSKYFAAHGERLPPSGLYSRILREIERPVIEMSLAATGGNQVQAARLLGLNRNTLRKKIVDLEIPLGFPRNGLTTK